jgi:two-component system, oxyanion-binding sensor
MSESEMGESAPVDEDNAPEDAATPPETPGRRDFIRKGAAIAGASALMNIVSPGIRSSAWAGGTDGLEKSRLDLGIIPLTDCAPIVIALEKGYFGKYGLVVAVCREASWASIRDKVTAGALDGAQMLAGMPIATTLGIGSRPADTITALSLDLNGNGITVSNALHARMLEADPGSMTRRPISARALRKVIEADRVAGRPPLNFAMVLPFSTHNYELRYWMASAGIDPDHDVRLHVIPPPEMVANLAAGNIDGYCVGEPWNQMAVESGIGHALLTDYEIWQNSPEKVFGVNLEWAERHPNTHKAALKALIEASAWLDKAENREEAVSIISAPAYIDAPERVVRSAMTGTWKYHPAEAPQPMPDFNVFHRYAANFPWPSHAAWLITQMYRWGQLEDMIDIRRTASRIYRTDLYREAAGELGLPYPGVDWKTEGEHPAPWTLDEASRPMSMGPDLFLDGRVYDPSRLMDYLRTFTVANLRVPLERLQHLNA